MHIPDVVSDNLGEEVLRFEVFEMKRDEEGEDKDQTAHQESIGYIVATNRLMPYQMNIF